MSTPIISVVVPVYNTEKYISKCLSSIENQTLSDIEVLIVDDCGKDGSIKLAEEYVERDHRFRIITHEHNKGLGGARNTGIDASKGEYIFFLDSDDWIPCDALQVMVDKSVETGCDMLFAKMAVEHGGTLDIVEYIEVAVNRILQLPNTNGREYQSVLFYAGNAGNRIYKRSLLTENNIRFIDRIYWEDMPFSLEVWYASKQVVAIPNIVHFHTIREDADNLSITQTRNKKSFTDRDIILDYIFKWAEARQADTEAVLLAKQLITRMLPTTRKLVEESMDGDLSDFLIGWFDTHRVRYEDYLEKMRVFPESSASPS